MRLRPLGIGELLEAAGRAAVAHRAALWPIAACIVLPLQVLAGIITAATLPDDELVTLSESDDVLTFADDLGTFFAGTAAVGLLQGVMLLLVCAASVRALGQAWLGHAPDGRASLGFALRRLPVLVAVAVLAFLASMAGLLLLFVGAIWLAVAFSVASPAVMVERRGPFAALGRSFRLVHGRWWATFATLLVAYLAVTIVAGILQAILAAIGGTGTVTGAALGTAGQAVGFVVLTPFLAAVVTLVYFDLRVRREGLDLVGVAAALGVAPPEISGAVPSAPPTPPPSAAPAPPAPSLWARDRSRGEVPPGWEPPSPSER